MIYKKNIKKLLSKLKVGKGDVMRVGLVNYYLRLKDYPTRYTLATLRLGEYLNSFNIDVDLYPISLVKNNYEDDAEFLNRKFDIIAISHYVWSIESTKKLVNEIRTKNKNKKIIIGGPEVKYINLDEYKDEYFIAGEGEETLLNLIRYIEDGEKNENFFKENPNVFNYKKRDYCVLNEKLKYKNPLFTKFSNIDKDFLYYETSRGCSYNCGYCGFKNRFEVANFNLNFVKEEIKRIGCLNFKEVFVIDANFGGTKERAKIIMGYFNKYAPNVLLTIYLRPEFIDDEFIEILNKANLKEIRIGIQTTNDKIPKWIRSNSLYHITNELPKLTPKSIPWKAELIVGLPGDDLKGLTESINYVEKNLNPTEICCYPLTVIKSTRMYDLVNKMGSLFWISVDKNNMAYESNSYTHDELLEMQKYAIFRMNNYLDNNYKNDDKILKKMRNSSIKKTID